MKRKVLTGFLVGGFLVNSALVFANTTGEEKKVQIEGTIQPYEEPVIDSQESVVIETEPILIDLTLPSEISFNINPNDVNGNYFTASEFLISNDSDVPLKVSVTGFQSTNKEGVHLFTDVLPTAHTEWLELTEEETMRDFTLGIKVVDPTQWESSVRTETIWAKEVQDSTDSIVIGNIPAKAQEVGLTLEAKHGLKFSKWINPSYDITLYFEFVN